MKTIITIFIAIFVLSTSVWAEATTINTNNKVSVNEIVFVPCAIDGAGEPVLFSGTVHIVFHITLDADGGTHIQEHSNYQNFTGIGLISGDRYELSHNTQTSSNIQSDGFPQEISIQNILNAVGQGYGNNLSIKLTIHTTFNNNGDATSEVTLNSVECD